MVLLVLLVLSYGWCCVRTVNCLCCVRYVLALVLALVLELEFVLVMLAVFVLVLAQVLALELVLAHILLVLLVTLVHPALLALLVLRGQRGVQKI